VENVPGYVLLLMGCAACSGPGPAGCPQRGTSEGPSDSEPERERTTADQGDGADSPEKKYSSQASEAVKTVGKVKAVSLVKAYVAQGCPNYRSTKPFLACFSLSQINFRGTQNKSQPGEGMRNEE
jgi:hypothetical protein